MNKLVVLSGVPGSGKSYFSNALKKSKKGHVYIVSSDALREQMMGNQQDLSQDRIMWKMYYKLAIVYSIDPEAIVVLDATHSSAYYRIEATKPIRPLFQEIDLVCFSLPKEIVKHQNRNRSYPIPEDVLENLIEKYEGPNEQDREYFSHIYEITDHEIEKVIEKI